MGTANIRPVLIGWPYGHPVFDKSKVYKANLSDFGKKVGRPEKMLAPIKTKIFTEKQPHTTAPPNLLASRCFNKCSRKINFYDLISKALKIGKQIRTYTNAFLPI